MASIIVIGCQTQVTKMTITGLGKDSKGCFIINESKDTIRTINAVDRLGKSADLCQIKDVDVGRQIIIMDGVK